MEKTFAVTPFGDSCCGRQVVCAGLEAVSGGIQRPVFVHFCPQRITRPRYLTSHLILVNVTSYPALHNFTTDNSDCEARPGMAWAICALAGNAGIGSRQVWVDLICSPFGSYTNIGVVALMPSSAGALASRK